MDNQVLGGLVGDLCVKGDSRLTVAEAHERSIIDCIVHETIIWKVLKGGTDLEQGIVGEVRDDPAVPSLDILCGMATMEECIAELPPRLMMPLGGGVTLESDGTIDVTDTINVIRDQSYG